MSTCIVKYKRMISIHAVCLYALTNLTLLHQWFTLWKQTVLSVESNDKLPLGGLGPPWSRQGQSWCLWSFTYTAKHPLLMWNEKNQNKDNCHVQGLEDVPEARDLHDRVIMVTISAQNHDTCYLNQKEIFHCCLFHVWEANSWMCVHLKRTLFTSLLKFITDFITFWSVRH